jgi:hypothetical protein
LVCQAQRGYMTCLRTQSWPSHIQISTSNVFLPSQLFKGRRGKGFWSLCRDPTPNLPSPRFWLVAFGLQGQGVEKREVQRDKLLPASYLFRSNACLLSQKLAWDCTNQLCSLGPPKEQ